MLGVADGGGLSEQYVLSTTAIALALCSESIA